MTLVSPWQDRHPRPGPDLPVVPPAETDVVVVGAGLAGLTTALLLGRAGLGVVVLEATHVGAGTTGRSTAKVSLLQGTQLSRVFQRQGPRAVDQYVTANREAQAWVHRFCADHDLEVQVRDAVTYAHGEAGRAAVEQELAVARRAGLEVVLDEELPLPYATSGGVRLPDQLQLDPMALLLALRRQAEAHGVVVLEGTRVRGVSGRAPLRVATEGGEVTGTHVVVATGMPILDRGAFFARATAARSYGLAYATPRPVVDAMYLSADQPSRSLRDALAATGPGGSPGSGAVLLVGGEGHPTGRDRSPRARLDRLRAWTAEHFPEAEETHAWSAQDYVTTRGLPYAGPVLPGTDHLLVAGGFSKWGMTNAVAAALALAKGVLGERPAWAAAFDTWDRRELGGLPGAALANAEVGLELTRGWLRPLRHPGPGVAPGDDGGQVRLDRVGPPTATSLVGGVPRRVSAVCTHLGGVVGWNDAERSWDCPLHGSRFDADGSVLEGPATCGLTPR
ncbi:FAD-dependent oxidoreductase [Nocardioides sp. Leaf285]|uniref:FAD-dependent oxidoreductase n=1 Tax=Nocardioides sp. Leaf285 TaxID=1736322 RepID=UPI0009E7E5B6|nr:FAD-dependent oxidoreductase [Nocardioides sp. Leaf285]